MWSILRWWENPNKDNRNRVFSRSLGKIAFVDTKFVGEGPKHDEFWLVDLVLEINPGKSSGCFLCSPLKQLEWNELLPLNSNMCTISNYDGDGSTLIITPVNFQEEGSLVPWILPFSFRKEILRSLPSRISSIIVNLGGKPTWETVNSQRK